MKLGAVYDDGGLRAALIEGDEVFVGEVELQAVIARGLDLRQEKGRWRKAGAVRFDVPLRPPMLLCTGSNYHDHVNEHDEAAAPTNAPKAEFEFFIKAGQTIAGLDDPLVLDPAFGAKIDQETELGLVIGPDCPRGVSEADAARYIFGYLVVNDVTARDKQVRLTQDGVFMVLGASKNFEGSTRLSSYIVTADEVPDLYDLPVRTRVNGALTQNNATANVINNFSLIVSTFASGLALQPGGIISTGTPAAPAGARTRNSAAAASSRPAASPPATSGRATWWRATSPVWGRSGSRPRPPEPTSPRRRPPPSQPRPQHRPRRARRQADDRMRGVEGVQLGDVLRRQRQPQGRDRVFQVFEPRCADDGRRHA